MHITKSYLTNEKLSVKVNVNFNFNYGDKEMKKLLIVVTSLVLSSAAYAGDKVENKDPCEVWSDLAKVIMGNRQQEIDLADMVKIAKGNEVVLNIVKMAYSRPAYSVKKNQDNAVKRFANDVYMICLER